MSTIFQTSEKISIRRFPVHKMSVQARKTLTKYPNVTEHQAETFRTGEKIVIRRDEQVNAKKYHKYLKKEGP